MYTLRAVSLRRCRFQTSRPDGSAFGPRRRPRSTIHIVGASHICAWIDTAKGLALRFPQLFSLAEALTLLAQFTTVDLRLKSSVALEMASDIAQVFVPTDAYRRALSVLQRHHFVVLEGPPEMGKTCIARMIALAMLREGWEAIECTHPSDLMRQYLPDIAQIFIADDSFGRTDYNPDRVSGWQHELPYILRKLDAHHGLLLTSRAHLLQMAKGYLDVSGFNEVFP